RYDEAIEQDKKTIELDPNFSTAYYFLARAYEAKGDYDHALEQYTTFARLGQVSSDVITRTVDIYKKSGWKAYLHASVTESEKLAEKQHIPAFVMAAFY